MSCSPTSLSDGALMIPTWLSDDWLWNGLWAIYIIVIGLWVVLQKRPPVSTLTWILFLSFVPALGFVIYYFFGPKKITRNKINRSISKHLIERDDTLWNVRIQPSGLTEQQRPIHDLALQITHYPLSYATSYQLLSGGEKTYDRIFEAVRKAEHYIFLEYYIFEQDQTGTTLRDLLTERARQGVKIYLIADAIGSLRLNRRFMRPLIQAGARLTFFHDISLKHLLSFMNLRNHRKIVICDGAVAFTGGINISDQQDRRRNKRAFHDVHLELTGPVVSWLETIFVEDWHYSTHDLSVRHMLREHYRDRLERLQEQAEDDAGKAAATRRVAPDDAGHDSQPAPPAPQWIRTQIIPSGPDFDYASILRVTVDAIQRARHRVYLTTPYFVPDATSAQALTSASLRGVDVRILLPKQTDNYVVTKAAQSWFDDLVASGIRVFEYGPRMLHTKSMIVDDDISFIGSANFDNRSFYLNFEVSVLCYERAANQALLEEFNASMQHAQEVQLTHQPFFSRLSKAVARLFSPLL